jgi:hypothetical protein
MSGKRRWNQKKQILIAVAERTNNKDNERPDNKRR